MTRRFFYAAFVIAIGSGLLAGCASPSVPQPSKHPGDLAFTTENEGPMEVNPQI